MNLIKNNKSFDQLLAKISSKNINSINSKYPWAIKQIKKGDCIHSKKELMESFSDAVFPKILDIIEDDNYLYIINENIRGENLEALIKREGRLDPGRASKLMLSLCRLLMKLMRIRPDITYYNEVKLSSIIISPNNEVKYIHIENIILSKAQHQLHINQIQGLGLLYYHLLTGKDPNKPGFVLEPFSQLGIYLPGDIYDIIQFTLSDSYSNIESLMVDIEKIFPTAVIDKEQKKSIFNSRLSHHKDKIIRIAGVTLAFSMFVTLNYDGFIKHNIASKSQSLNQKEVINQEIKHQENGIVVIEQTPSAQHSTTASIIIDDVHSTTEIAILNPQPEAEPEKRPTKVRSEKNNKQLSYLSDKKPAHIEKGYEAFTFLELDPINDKDINGCTFQSGIKVQFINNCLLNYNKQWIEAEYELDKPYSRLCLTYSLSYENIKIAPEQKAWMNIFGNEKLLFSTESIGSESDPIKVDISIKGVNRIKLQINPASQFTEDVTFIIGEPQLIP